jgi:hypothetical protein
VFDVEISADDKGIICLGDAGCEAYQAVGRRHSFRGIPFSGKVAQFVHAGDGDGRVERKVVEADGVCGSDPRRITLPV